MSAALTAWPFVIAAYAIAVGGTLALTAWSLAALRRAERRADAFDRPRADARSSPRADARPST